MEYIYIYIYIYEGGAHARTSLTGVTVGVDVSAQQKVWRTFQALGDIAFAYAYSTVLIEIQASHNCYSLNCLNFHMFNPLYTILHARGLAPRPNMMINYLMHLVGDLKCVPD
jgi:hypothetical protein